MKADIHPKYVECSVSCACGNKFLTRSIKSEIRTDICSACHPYYTGAQKFVDSAGRVDKFLKRYGKSKDAMAKDAMAKDAMAKDAVAKDGAPKAGAKA